MKKKEGKKKKKSKEMVSPNDCEIEMGSFDEADADDKQDETEDNRRLRSRKREVPLCDRFLLTISEASDYFGIGINKLRSLASKPGCSFIIWIGSRKMIKRKKLEEYLDNTLSI